jgi:hypothetical protein
MSEALAMQIVLYLITPLPYKSNVVLHRLSILLLRLACWSQFGPTSGWQKGGTRH